MSQKVLGGGLLVGVGYVLYQLFNSDENKADNPDLELKDVTKNILKGKNDYDLEMERVDLDKEEITVEEQSSTEIPVEESTSIEDSSEEITSVEESSEEPTSLEESSEEITPVEESSEETTPVEESSLEDVPTDESNTIERIVRI